MPWTFPSEIQGWLTEDEGRLLADLARLKRVLEVGSYHGRSSVCMAQTASWLVSVDHHRDDDKNRLDSLDYLTANLKRYGVLDRTIVVLGRSAEVARLPTCGPTSSTVRGWQPAG
jgi:predicted O-methyltransferase YrrM